MGIAALLANSKVDAAAASTGREVAAAAEEAAMAPATARKAVSKKRKLEKTADASAAVAEGPLQEGPKGQLQGHSQCVPGVAWPDQDTIFSGSWDHSVSLILPMSCIVQTHWSFKLSNGLLAGLLNPIYVE